LERTSSPARNDSCSCPPPAFVEKAQYTLPQAPSSISALRCRLVALSICPGEATNFTPVRSTSASTSFASSRVVVIVFWT
jgi:hypothetical protein